MATRKSEKQAPTRQEIADNAFGVRKPTEEESKMSETDLLQGTLPDVLDPAAPNVTTMDRQAEAGSPGSSTPVAD